MNNFIYDKFFWPKQKWEPIHYSNDKVILSLNGFLYYLKVSVCVFLNMPNFV